LKPKGCHEAAPQELDDCEWGSSESSIGYPQGLIGEWGDDRHQFDTVDSDGENSPIPLHRRHRGSSSAEMEGGSSSTDGDYDTQTDDGQTVCLVVLFQNPMMTSPVFRIHQKQNESLRPLMMASHLL
jgi:hypothetical protein